MSPKALAAVGVLLAIAAVAGCTATSRHKGLTIFFDGVPPLKPEQDASAAAPDAGASGPAPPPPVYKEHAPYAAKACDSCHDPAAMNALIVPKEELCALCHETNQDVKFIHGPLASGGCLVCHDPHRSRYDALLVSEAASFCFRCHDRDALLRIDEHRSPEADCIACHNAHGSDKQYLLR